MSTEPRKCKHTTSRQSDHGQQTQQKRQNWENKSIDKLCIYFSISICMKLCHCALWAETSSMGVAEKILNVIQMRCLRNVFFFCWRQ